MTGDCHVQFSESARVRLPRATRLIFTLTPTILGMSIFNHDASCIMGVQERSAQITPEHAIVKNETVKKQFALSTRRVPGHISSMIVGAPYPMM